MTEDDAGHSVRLKHLEFIQQTITRLAGNSFLVKGWSMTVVAALLAWATNKTDYRFATLAAMLSILFWALDAYYLWQERSYRMLYEHVRLTELAHLVTSPFGMRPSEAGTLYPVTEAVEGPGDGLLAPFRPAVGVFHAAVLIAALALQRSGRDGLRQEATQRVGG
jgi:hypothetical protein